MNVKHFSEQFTMSALMQTTERDHQVAEVARRFGI